MITGTAGHIDHGKSTLVRALTGVETDRLPEERQRGMSIELGYAFMPLDRTETGADAGARIGFIDVPGHEKLVHTMIAGATGMDFALLLVAADDGIMPQTREHLAVLSLLGIQRGAVVLTKTDRVDAARLEQVAADVRALLQGTSLAQAPLLPVSAQSGEGLPALRALLQAEARRHHGAGQEGGAVRASAGAQPPPALPSGSSGPPEGFRLAIDRVFSLEGRGTVVTGTVHAGQLGVGERLDQAPGGLAGLRVRSLHAQNQKTVQARAGQRCAIALAGVERAELARGQWLVQPGLARPAERIDVVLTLWPGEARALRSGTPVHLHLGTASVTASVAILDRDSLAPGAEALAQLVLHRPLAAWHGDRLILRDAAGQRVMAGGRVLDPVAPARYRRTPQRLQLLAALQQPLLAGRLAAMLAVLDGGIPLDDWQQRFGLADRQVLDEALAGVAHRRMGAGLVIGDAAWQRLRDSVLAALQGFHEQWPDELGPDAARLRRLTRLRIDEASWQAMLNALLQAGDVALSGAFVHLPGHGVELAARDEALLARILPALQAAAAQGVWLRDLAALAGEPPAAMRAAMARLARSGHACMIVKDLYQSLDSTRALGQLFRQLAARQSASRPAVTVAMFRDASGLGRKRAVQILEFFDRIGLCRRVGDQHLLRAESRLFLEE